MNLRLLVFAFILLLAFCPMRSALAHGEARLEVSPERLSPGASLTIHGADFSYDQELTLALHGTGIELPLGTVIADVEGAFALTIMLPLDLREGSYQVHAVAVDIEVVSPAITIEGAPVVSNEEGGQGGISEEDGLLAPAPTLPPGFSSTPLPAQNTGQAANNSSLVGIGLGLLAVLGVVLFAIRLSRSLRSGE